MLKTSQSRIIRSITTLKVRVSEMHQLLQLPAASNVINAAAVNTFAAAVSTSSTIAGGDAALALIFHFKCSCKSVTHKVGSDISYMASDSCLHIYFIERVQMKHCIQGTMHPLAHCSTSLYSPSVGLVSSPPCITVLDKFKVIKRIEFQPSFAVLFSGFPQQVDVNLPDESGGR